VGLEAEESEEKAEMEMRDRAGKKRKDGSRDEIQTMAQAYKIGGLWYCCKLIADIFTVKLQNSGI
jgi:hypothetical protein